MAINSPDLQALLDSGEYGKAAELAEVRALWDTAAELYAKVWRFVDATRCARQAGNLASALRYALDARDDVLIAAVSQALSQAQPGQLAETVEILVKHKRFASAARAAETLGRLDDAIDFYQRAQLDLDAARLLEEVGRDREAGQLLEQVIQVPDQEVRVHARLRLGRLLARCLQHDRAIPHLQDAFDHASTRDQAAPLLITEFVALGLRTAARNILATARREGVELPETVDDVVRQWRLPPVTENAQQELLAGRYRLEALLGAGASGRVHAASDLVSGRQVAIKLFHTNFGHGTPAFERFVRETRIARSLDHPNIVATHSFSAESGYIVMELMSGGSLAERLARSQGPVPLGAVRPWLLDVLSGLSHAHQHSIVHRDLKPENIFFDATGTAKLGDFGVAHLVDMGYTQTGGLIGTLAYMPPEQITGAKVGVGADIYALGITLYHALAGQLPFTGPDFIAQHLGEAPAAFAELGVDVPPHVEAMVMRMLAKDPRDRFDGVERVREAFDKVADTPAPRVLVLPKPEGMSAQASGPPQEAVAEDSADEAERGSDDRYQHLVVLTETDSSSISRALDSALKRSVIIERFDDADASEGMRRLARIAAPQLQRVLSFDDSTSTAVYEAPAGQVGSELVAGRQPPIRVAHLVRGLAAGFVAIHDAGLAYGQLGLSKIVCDDVGNPTVLVQGLGASKVGSPQDDVVACLNLAAQLLTGDPAQTQSALGALASPGLPAGALPTSAHGLFTWADAWWSRLVLSVGE